ncbi:scavenger mRNA decapping enzyme c-term binding domain-containing protein [Ditylenchus destructor]|uniref:m7GpppX diphosphatase n=1 Tax=Ditylenchus destructor TaxID=166010 RepID=A0AAD4R9W1_9BILA|nr:scavenger mRNA decapping enzyme c-term binding domain-containing protein [Ditylenchus destructor]
MGDAGDEQKGGILKSLENFVFKEVLGGDIARKAIFVHLEHAIDKKPAVLICDKHPFAEEEKAISEWVGGSKLRHLVSNNVYGNYELLMPEKFNEIKSTFIYPATEKHIEKYRRQNVCMIHETPEDYKNITLAFINEAHFDNTWVYNFLDKKAEADRIVFEDEDKHSGFIVAPDLKWNGRDLDNLYLQAIVHRRDLRSVRDLTANELPLLEKMRDSIEKVALEKWGLEKSQLKLYFHYQPTYYHLHLHVINLKYEAPGLSSTCIDLYSVIDNLKLLGDYYQKATLPFVRKKNDPLYQKFLDAGRV